MAKVRIARSRQLTGKLRALRQDTQIPVRAALASVADDVVGMAKRQVPDGAGSGRFDLGESIKWKFGADEGGGTDAKTGRSAATSVTISAGDENNPEARWVEFGTAPRTNGGIYAGSQHPGTPPQPYFYPSFRAHKDKAKRKINKAIRDAVKKVAAK